MANLVDQQEMFFSAFEPKMQNRFIMELEGVPAYVIKGVTRPTLRQDAKPINHINVQRYVKGRTVWQPITLTLHDPIVPSAAQAVMEWVRLHHESVTGRDGYADFYKKDLTFNVLGPVGDKVEEWVIKGAQIVEANFGEMNWDNDDPANITLQIQPDYCILNY